MPTPPDERISELSVKSSPAGTLEVVVRDPSDTTMAPTGTNFRATLASLGPGIGLATAGTKVASGSGGTVASVTGAFTPGHVATFADSSGTIQDGGAPSGSGTVTSVGLSMPSGLSVASSPVTGSGTIAVTTALSGVLKGTGSGFAVASAGTDYLAPTGSGAGLTGITASQVGALGDVVETAVKTGAYTAVPGNFIPTNSTSGTVPITLPTAPADKSVIGVKMVVLGGSNTTTIAAGAGDAFNVASGSTTLTLSALRQGVLLRYSATPKLWYVIAADPGAASAGSPGGSSGQIQYNSTSAFAGAAWSAVLASGNLLTITAQAAADVPLTVAGTASQSGLLSRWLDPSGNVIVSVGPNGGVSNNIVHINMTSTAATHISLDSAGTQVGTIGLQGVILKMGGTQFQGTFTQFAWNGPRLGWATTDPLGTATTLCQSYTVAPTLSGAAGYNAYRFDVAEVTVGSGTMNHTILSRAGTPLYTFDRFCRPVTNGTAPGIAAGTGAGTSPTVSLAGNDVSGVITITTGTSPSASATVATITFANAFAAAPKSVTLTPAEGNAGALTGTGAVFAGLSGISTTVWTMTVGSSALAAATTYKFNYVVNG